MKRSFLSYLVVALLFIVSYSQVYLYQFFKMNAAITGFLLETGYVAGIAGVAFGIMGVIFVITSQFRPEMGSLETLGYRRLWYLFYYFMQFLILCISSVLISFLFSIILLNAGTFNNLETGAWFYLHLNLSWKFLLFYSLFTYLTLLLHAIKDPFLLLKEK